MRFRAVVIAALIVVGPSWCGAEEPLTPTQALSYTTIGGVHFSPDGSELVYVAYNYRWDDVGRLRIVDVGTGKMRELTPPKAEERSPDWSPDGKTLAFLSTRGGRAQIYLQSVQGGEPTALTSHKLGVANFHWSPDGRAIAYLAQDDSATTSGNGPQVADQEDSLARLWVVDVASKATRRVGISGFRIRDSQWQDPKHLLITATDQPWVEQWTDAIYSVSIDDGSVRLVSRPPQPVGASIVSPDGREFAVRANLSGGPDIRDVLVGSLENGDLRQIAVPRGLGVSEMHWHEQHTLWLNVRDGFVNRIVRVSSGSAPQPVDLTLSVDSFDVSRNGLLAFAGQDYAHLPQVYVRTKDGHIRQLGEAQDETWRGVHLAPTTVFKTRSFDGMEIESALVKPTVAPAAGGKYPLVLLVHGGPGSNFSAGYDWEEAWAQLLAAHGYEVLMVNPRGSRGYSAEFLKANRGDLGGGDYKDLLAVLDAVIARGDTDPARLGIGGWSYGGEMAAWAITQTDRFKAAVAGAPVYDQQAEFEAETPGGATSDTWYFGTPWEHPEVFARISPATFIGRAHTPTLILDGEDDTANPVFQSKGLYRALKHLGVETQLVLYPHEGHSPRLGSNNVDMFTRILEWYDRHLK